MFWAPFWSSEMILSGPFKWPGSALMWPCCTLKKSSWT